MFVHHVFFWLKPGANKEALRAGLQELVQIDLIRQSHIGEAVPSPRDVVDDSFDFSLLCFFDSAADQDIYQDHPDHHVFINNCSHLWERVVVYDAID